MKVADILTTKGSSVVSIGPDRPVHEAMRLLVEHNIGALLVLDGKGTISGILSERDLLRAAAADPHRLASASVTDLMTAEVVTTSADTDIRELMDVMTERRIRHLPVLARGAVCGLVSIGDIVNALRRSVEAENQQLHAYIAGTTV